MEQDKKSMATPYWITILIVAAAGVVVASLVFTASTGESGSGLGDDFEYEIDHLRATDPDLVLYEEAGAPVPTGLKSPIALAVGPGDVICVAGDEALRFFGPDGKKLPLEIDLSGAPRCVALAGDGTIYAGVADHLEQYGGTGKQEKVWESAGKDAHLTSIALAPDQILVADFTNREVIRYDLDGERLGSFGDFVIPSPYFDIARSSDGLLHVTNTGEHRVEAYTPAGDLMTWWGSFSNSDAAAFSGCCNPVNIALLPGGKGFVTTEKGLTRVKVYDMQGEFLGFVAGSEKFQRHDRLCSAPDFDLTRAGLDVAVDSKGRIIVLDPVTAKIRFFERGEKK